MIDFTRRDQLDPDTWISEKKKWERFIRNLSLRLFDNACQELRNSDAKYGRYTRSRTQLREALWLLFRKRVEEVPA